MLPELRTNEFETKIIGKLKKAFTINKRITGDVIYKIKEKQTEKFVLATKRSNQKWISNWQMEQIRKQLFMNRNDFLDFLNCPLSAEDYRQHLIDKKII